MGIGKCNMNEPAKPPIVKVKKSERSSTTKSEKTLSFTGRYMYKYKQNLPFKILFYTDRAKHL